MSEDDYVKKLKTAYKSTTDKNVRKFILTLVPENWSVKRTAEEFEEATTYIVKKSRKSDPTESQHGEHGRSLKGGIISVVKDFYCSDHISRIMPGKKDTVSIKVDGEKKVFQKRLILGNLRETYRQFKESYPDKKIGFSKFAALRPKYCVLAGSSGTHSICVCCIHQNMKLMLESCKIERLTKDGGIHIANYQSCLALVICNPPNIPCFFNECKNCPGYENVRKIFENAFENNNVESITFNQWTSTDRAKLETFIQSTEDFVDNLIEGLPKLLFHDFIAKEQSKHIQQVKNNLKIGEVVVIMDFAENYYSTFIRFRLLALNRLNDMWRFEFRK